MNKSIYILARGINNKIRKFLITIDIEKYSKRKYYKKFGKNPDLVSPKTFNEKILWIAINYHNPLYTKCADKVCVRDYLEQKLGKEQTDELLCPKYGIWDDANAVEFNLLPDSFVLKSNHASGQVILCEDKSKLNVSEVRKTLNSWLKENYYYSVGEWQYKNIKPMVICEKLLDNDITDYRIFCFEGKPTYIKVTKHNSKSPGGYDYNMYYPDWAETEFRMDQSYGELNFDKPEKLDYMIDLAKQLSADFHFVRVDFFTVADKVYFAELTFTPNSGCEKYTDDEVDIRFGKMFALPDDEFVGR